MSSESYYRETALFNLCKEWFEKSGSFEIGLRNAYEWNKLFTIHISYSISTVEQIANTAWKEYKEENTCRRKTIS